MRILYGVCGEGFGHSSRAIYMVHHLIERGHKVLIFSYGQAVDVLRREGFDVFEIRGVHLSFREGVLSVSRTLKNVLETLYENIRNWKEMKSRVEGFGADVCISDMELVVPIISFIYRLPLISLDNQHRLTHLDVRVPRRYRRDFFIARKAVKRVVSRADAFIILSFVRGAVVRDREKSFVVDPILRKEVLGSRKQLRRGDYVLVYLTKRDEGILRVLRQIDERFVVYVYGSRRRGRLGNMVFRDIGLGFLRDLVGCKGVIGSAGFTLISEALYLGKPYFALPLRGQFEQTLNALFLKQAGYGMFSEDLKREEVEGFLNSLRKYEKRVVRRRIDSGEAARVLDRVLREISRKRSDDLKRK